MLTGPAGQIEALVDEAITDAPARGIAVIAHPHPLFGGTMENKVVQTLARAFIQCGWRAVRFNFRGVGQSQGVHDEGRGEVQDFLAVVTQSASTGPLSLAGFSFGSYIMCESLKTLWTERSIEKLVLVGTAASRFQVAPMPPGSHQRTLVVHGELDDTVPLSGVMDWARPQVLPVTVVPGGSHFFHGQLPLLKNLVTRHLNSTSE